MKKGFTMVELIFVIVILGILAAVAIPKLAATRDDAEATKFAKNLSILLTDCASFYTSQGDYQKDISKMTNVRVINKNDFTAELPLKGTGCIKLVLHNENNITTNAIKGSLEILPINTNNLGCKNIQELPTISSYIKAGKYIINSAVIY